MPTNKNYREKLRSHTASEEVTGELEAEVEENLENLESLQSVFSRKPRIPKTPPENNSENSDKQTVTQEKFIDRIIEVANDVLVDENQDQTNNSIYQNINVLVDIGIDKDLPGKSNSIYENIPQIVENQEVGKELNQQISCDSIVTENLNNYSDNIKPLNRKKCKMATLNLEQKIRINEFIRGISTFAGKKDSNLEESLQVFLDECHNALEMFSELDEKQYFLSLIKSRLRGDARNLAISKQFKTLEELQNFIHNYYIPRKDPTEITREINTIIQKAGESIQEYSERLQGLVEVAYDLYDQLHKDQKIAEYYKKDIEKQAIRSFKFGIRDHTIQTALFLENSDDMEAVIKAALKWEKIEKLRHNPLQYSQEIKLDKPEDGNKTDILLGKILENLQIGKQSNSTQQLINTKEAEITRENKYCSFCHRKGHTISECRTKRNTPFCNYCHQYYHTMEKCPRRLDRDKKTEGNMQFRDYGQRQNPQYNQRNYGPPNTNNRQQMPQRNNYVQSYPVRQSYPQKQVQEMKPFSPQKIRPQYGVRLMEQNNYSTNSNESNYMNEYGKSGNSFYEGNRVEMEKHFQVYDQGNELGAVCSQQTSSP